MGDLIKEVKAQLYDRISNPLFVCFVASWGIWNWRLILGVLFGTGYEMRQAVVQEQIAQSGTWFQQLWFFPLLSAILYILIYPWVARCVYWYWENQQKELKRLRQKIEDATPISQEEAIRLRRTNREELRRMEGEVDEMQKRVQELQLALNEYEQKVSNLENDKVELTKQLGKAIELAKQEVLTPKVQGLHPLEPVAKDGNIFDRFDKKSVEIAKNKGGISENSEIAALLALVLSHTGSAYDLAESTGINRIIIENGLDGLYKNGLVESFAGKWHLSERAKKIVVDSGLVKI